MMKQINHNAVWTAINSMNRITRELAQGSCIEDTQLDELIAAVNKCKEALDNGPGKK